MAKLCIYHGNCADGFTSAWVVRKALGDEVQYHAGVYQDAPPDVEGKDVLLVDFSYKRAVLEAMREKAASVTILDHHKTAEADLRDLLGITTVFDMNRSGARITWDYFFPNAKPPQLLLHVEDRDLWRFALRKTREIQASVFAYPYEFKVWDYLMTADMEQLAVEGEAIERKHFKDIRELVSVVTRRMNIGGYNVPIANLPYTLTSDAGHLLAKGEPFAGCYWDTPKGRVFSLRSTDEGLDVAEIAKQYGGGGHRNASGFRLGYSEAMALEVGVAPSQA
jgi:oligoribonuclease NrnB/cAMP/cGMP phosphodiesterase (DHH superfamily)